MTLCKKSPLVLTAKQTQTLNCRNSNQSELCSGITCAAHEQLFPLALHQLTAEDSIRITQLFKYIYLTYVAKGLAGRKAKLNLQLQTWLTWLRSEGKSSLLLVFKYKPKFSECLLRSCLNTQAQKHFGLYCKGCSVAPPKSHTRNVFIRMAITTQQ